MMKYRRMSTVPADINTALVLSGGGAKGAYQVGVIKQLFKMEISFDLLTGTSIGALNGALLAEFIHRKMERKEIIKRLEQAWTGFDSFLTLNYSGFLSNLLSPTKIPSIFTNKNIRKILHKYIPPKRKFSDYTGCQLSITGTNLTDKSLHIFDFNSNTTVIEAVVASMSYPVAFPAVNIAGNYYIDGGVLNNVPLKEAVQWGAENIYLVFLRPLSTIEERDPIIDGGYSALEVIEEYLDLASNHLMYGDLKRADKINQLIKLLNIDQHKLPAGFLSRLKKLFGLKYEGGKRLINIERIAPVNPLTPPGLRGFDNHKAIKAIIKKGEEDTRAIFARN